MQRFRLQYLDAKGAPHEYLGDLASIQEIAGRALAAGDTTCAIIQDHRAAVEEDLDALEPHVRIAEAIAGGFHPK